MVDALVTPGLRQRADASEAMAGPSTEFPDIAVEEIEVVAPLPSPFTSSRNCSLAKRRLRPLTGWTAR